MQRTRRTKVDMIEDLLPEHVQYRDISCDVSPTCLTCPLPVCRYDVRGGLAAIQRHPRDEALIARRREGVDIERLCLEFRLSRRTVFRIIAAAREGQGRAD